jgi:methylmalonic aciduria homocystinuria type C protein
MDDDIAALRARCDAAGLDVVHPFRLHTFNEGAEAHLRLPDFGRADALAIVIGNSVRLWEPFTRALRKDAALAGQAEPLDAYVEAAVVAAARDTLRARHAIFWAHRGTPAPIAIQRIAHESGLAHLSPSRLSVHRSFGPWLALRAVVVVDAAGPDSESLCAHDPCTACAKPCVAAFDRALAASGAPRADDIEREWEAWAHVRDVCPEGRSFRYGDDQLRYHYTKDRSILRRLVR